MNTINRNSSDKSTSDTWDTSVDYLMGGIYCLCFTFGAPANLLSFVYFMRQRSSASSNKRYVLTLYRLITFNDTIICLLVLPIVYALFNNRKFSNNTALCVSWGLAWNIVPVIAVFLVAILSFSRMWILLYPLKNLKLALPLLLLVLLTLAMLTEKLSIEFGLAGHSYFYFKKRLICYISTEKDDASDTNYTIIQTITFLVLLGLPVLPILLSFSISVYRLNLAARKAARLTVSSADTSAVQHGAKHRKATVTVFLVTALYICCNIPILACHIYYSDYAVRNYVGHNAHNSTESERSASNSTDSVSKKAKSIGWEDKFMTAYFWNICYALLVAVNASINPVIYLSRMDDYRKMVVQNLRLLLALRATSPDPPAAQDSDSASPVSKVSRVAGTLGNVEKESFAQVERGHALEVEGPDT